jgi:hypothetical protein
MFTGITFSHEQVKIDVLENAANLDLCSPLLDAADGPSLPNIASLDRRMLCNGATVQAERPLVVSMPKQRWSYGLIFPLDRQSMSIASQRILVRMVLSVQGGVVGIAGVGPNLASLTTSEQAVTRGPWTVTLLIGEARVTEAIFVRSISDVDTCPEVTILGISAYCVDAPRLQSRRHDLAHDLFVILSNPKTATQTIERTLLALDPAVQVRRTHIISPKAIARYHQTKSTLFFPDAMMQSMLEQADYAQQVRREIAFVRNLGGRIALISGNRDPIDQVISNVFQFIPHLIPEFALLRAAGVELLSALSDYTRLELQRELDALENRSFFDEELLPVAKMELLREPIDRERGFSLFADANTSVLLFRYKDLHRVLPTALSALTGRGSVPIYSQNTSREKGYADLYREFRASFRVPAELCAALYRRYPYLRHFYTEAEIAEFEARWSMRCKDLIQASSTRPDRGLRHRNKARDVVEANDVA